MRVCETGLAERGVACADRQFLDILQQRGGALQRQRIGLVAAREVDGSPVVRDQLVVDAPKDILERSIDQELVDDGISQRISCDATLTQ